LEFFPMEGRMGQCSLSVRSTYPDSAGILRPLAYKIRPLGSQIGWKMY
jgi:hypothetical protein